MMMKRFLLKFTLITCWLVVSFGSALASWRKTQQDSQVTTKQLLAKMSDYRNSLDSTSDERLMEILELLVKSVADHQERLDRTESVHSRVQSQLTNVEIELNYMKYYTYEQMTLYRREVTSGKAGSAVRAPPAPRGRNFASWDNSVMSLSGRLTTDVQVINETLVGLSLRVATLDNHLEEVEAIVREVKKNYDDDFGSIINSLLIPKIQESVAENYKKEDNELKQQTEGHAGKAEEASIHNVLQTESVSTTTISNETLLNIMPQDDEDSYNPSMRANISSGCSEQAEKVLISQEQLAELYLSKGCSKEPHSVAEITQVKNFVGGRRKIIGAWMSDGYVKSQSIWVLQGYRRLDNLLEFSSLRDLLVYNISRNYTLPFECGGTGHVVYNRVLYCAKFKSNKINSYQLDRGLSRSTRLPGEDIHSTNGYAIAGFNDIDLITDNLGLWLTFSNQNSSGQMILVKFDPVTLKFEFISRTSLMMKSYMNSFMICGELYVVKRAETGEVITRKAWSIYNDVNETLEPSIVLESRRSEVILSADFNPLTQRLHTWNLLRMGAATLKWYQFYYK